MHKPSDIKRMFDVIDNVITWRERPASDFTTRHACKYWHKTVCGTPFEDDSYIHIKGRGRRYSIIEVWNIINLTFEKPVEPMKMSPRELATEEGYHTYKGKKCDKCASTKRYTESGQCVNCYDSLLQGKPVWTRSFAKQRFVLDRGVLYYGNRPKSDFTNDKQWAIWCSKFAGKRVGKRVAFYIHEHRITKTVDEIIKLVKPVK